MNSTSSDPPSVADTDYLTVSCDVSYLAVPFLILSVECLPNTVDQTEVRNITGVRMKSVKYKKSFSVTPDMNGIVINCTFDFNSIIKLSGFYYYQANDTTNDIQLWKSAPLHVLCKQLLYAKIF